MLVIVDDPNGTPITKKIQAGNLFTDGWIADGLTWTYTGSFTFTIPGDVTAIYQKGTFLRWKQGGGWKYGVVASSSYSAPNTTITIFTNTNYTIANAAITDTGYSYAANPQGWPRVFAYTASVTPNSGTFTTVSIDSYFSVSGNLCSVYFSIVITTNGTAVGINVSMPTIEQSLATLTGRETQTTGVMLQGIIYGQICHIYDYAGNYINADGRTIYMNGEFWF